MVEGATQAEIESTGQTHTTRKLSTAVLSAGFSLTGAGTVLLGVLLPTLSQTWGLRDDQAGLLLFLQFFASGLGMYDHLEGPDHVDTAGALVNLAVVDLDDNQLPRAREELERALAVYERVYGADAWQLVTCLTDLGVVAKDQDRLDDASKYYERGLAIVEKTYGPDHPDAADLASNLVDVRLAQHRVAEAAPLAERALRGEEKAYGKNHPNYALALANAGLVASAQGDHAKALADFTESAKILQARLGDANPTLAEVRGYERAERAKLHR